MYNEKLLTSEQCLNLINSKFDMLEKNITSLLQAQNVSNYLAVANNPNVDDEIRAQALNLALNMLPFLKNNKSESEQMFR